MTDMLVASATPVSPLTTADQALIAELCTLTRKLDRYGALGEVAGDGTLLPVDILDRPMTERIAHLSEARDRCRRRLRKLTAARRSRRLLAVMLPFVMGAAGTPYLMHLLA